jgi:hypothetical protein
VKKPATDSAKVAPSEIQSLTEAYANFIMTTLMFVMMDFARLGLHHEAGPHIDALMGMIYERAPKPRRRGVRR